MSTLIALPACLKTRKTCLYALHFLLILTTISMSQASPHAFKRLTWQVISQTGETVWQTSANHAPLSWWPDLTPDFCQLAAGLDTWDIPDKGISELNTSHGSSPHSQRTYTGGSYWACNTELTPCVSAQIFNNSHEFCVLVQLWPHVTYHEESSVIEFFGQRGRYTPEPVSMTTALMLGIRGIAAGVGTGTTGLVQINHLMQLQMAMTTNLEVLEKSLTSLSEVVLQNIRGLDLLFLKEGGLCAALKEECCFYADHTGVVRESMENLRERLAQRKREFENQRGWFEDWLQGSPWLPTLIPTILTPLIIFLLLITFGPCAFQRLTQFIKS